MSNWKAAGPDHVQGYFGLIKPPGCIPNSNNIYKSVNAVAVPTWMTEGRTLLIMKDKSKGTVVGIIDQLLAFH